MAITTEAPAFLPADTFELGVAANIRSAAARRGLSQSDIARALGVARAGISMKWRGQRPWSLADIEGVARVLRTTPSELCAIRDSNPEPAGLEHRGWSLVDEGTPLVRDALGLAA
ncbi:MAG: helix-turn-helix domain-containing protein [Promicromonosporaceae bacterium]|nr:helix-turn-helix domain-containing protein [Promicromonosporaceae bacterium]